MKNEATITSKPRGLFISELFGPTFQGEGKNVGMPAFFLRLAGCNLACVWCDTRYAWDWATYDVRKEARRVNVADLCRELEALGERSGIRSLVITGGEPMIQQKNLFHLTRFLHYGGWHTEIETAGTIAPKTTELAKHWTISPKLSNSQNPLERRIVPQAIEALSLAPSRVFKFVVAGMGDLDEVDDLVERFSLAPVYIMPMGTDGDTLKCRAHEVADAAIARGYWISPRLHVDLYGNERGR